MTERETQSAEHLVSSPGPVAAPDARTERKSLRSAIRQRLAERRCLSRGDSLFVVAVFAKGGGIAPHPPPVHVGVHRLTRMQRSGGAALVVCLALVPAACQQARQDAVPISASPQARTVIEKYLRKVDGQYGALALSRDGTRAAYYICQSRLWKNCDDDELRDRFVSIPSAELAGRAALSRCGGGCSILYRNDRWAAVNGVTHGSN